MLSIGGLLVAVLLRGRMLWGLTRVALSGPARYLVVLGVIVVGAALVAGSIRHALERRDDKVRAAVLLEVERDTARKIEAVRQQYAAVVAEHERGRATDVASAAAVQADLAAARARLASLQASGCRVAPEKVPVLNREAPVKRVAARKPSGGAKWPWQ